MAAASVTAACGARAVTVVVAAYDAAATVGQALASVAAQTVGPAAVIVVDDCSRDGTADRAAAWADRLPLTVVRRTSNGGPAAARHDGVTRAATPLVALLDADDLWLPDHLQTLLAEHRGDTHLVSADALRWVPGRALGPRFGESHPLPRRRQLEALLHRNALFMGTLFSRGLYDRVGGFRERFRGPEDWDLWIRMVRAGATVSRPAHPTVIYRSSASSLSNRDAQVDQDVAVLAAAVEEAADDRERRAARRGLVRARAQRALYQAYRLAEDGSPSAARGAAAGALRGSRRVAVRGAAMLAAPSWTAARRRARMEDPQWWARR